MLPIQGRAYFDEETQGGVCLADLPWAWWMQTPLGLKLVPHFSASQVVRIGERARLACRLWRPAEELFQCREAQLQVAAEPRPRRVSGGSPKTACESQALPGTLCSELHGWACTRTEHKTGRRRPANHANPRE